jgi:molecular chaperone GrpE
MAKEEKATKEEVQEKIQKEENSADETLNEDQKDENVVSLEERVQASEDKFLRIFSEFENFRKRTQKEKAELITGAAADVYKVLLPILDDLDRAKSNIDKAENIVSLKEGLNLIFEKLSKSLKLNGLEQMDVKEQDFNADEHEAITNIPAPSEELKGKVLDIVEKGYKLNGKIIRFPKVVVGA